ncbi:MAG TPA: hypothetical protein VFE53_26315 [Mucilaginibacter sp.]|jgi:hypothetical protein|nr:hypothetical protein [Mucilaginibacter sp.]
MGIFPFFRNKNGNNLSYDEKEAAEILKNIVNGLITMDIQKYSIGLYYLAFKRSNKKLVRFEELLDPINALTKPKLIHYLGIYNAIKEIVETFISGQDAATMSLKQYEATVLYILQQAAKRINAV